MNKRTRHFRTVLGFAIVALFVVTASAENWARFRGPNGQGVSGEKGIPAKWSENDFVWKIEMPGTGHSSPIIWNDKVFVTFANDETAECTLMAVRASDGATLWAKVYVLEPHKINKLNSYAVSTPVADADAVYVIWCGAGHSIVAAVDHNGKELWKKDFGPTRLQHGTGASLIVFRDIVVFTLEQEENDEGLQSYWYALDRRNGEVKWRIERKNSGSGSCSTPCVYPSKDEAKWLVFTSRAHGFTAVDPDTGKVAWEKADAMPARAVSSPVLAGDMIVNTCGKGGGGVQLTALNPPADGTSEPEIAYTVDKKIASYVPTPLAAAGRLFVFHDQGLVTCLDGPTGNVLWSEKPGGKFYGSPVLVDGRIYCINMDGQVVVLNAGDKYELLAVNDLGEASHATPAVANGKMVLRTVSHMYCVAAK
jgi:outer membrane protein assembly factor BamB